MWLGRKIRAQDDFIFLSHDQAPHPRGIFIDPLRVGAKLLFAFFHVFPIPKHPNVDDLM